MDPITLSVVIPAFNEEAVIGPCLEALGSQIDEIDEIVVVDNNSTDATAEIAGGIDDAHGKVRVISELEPGLIPARNTGIGAAKFEIVARIDADTIVEPGWADAIRSFFGSADPAFVAALGPFTQYDMPLQGIHRLIMGAAAGSKGDTGVKEVSGLYGANMVIRKTAWDEIATSLNEGQGIWEDLDISLSLAAAGYKMALIDGMRAQVSGRRMQNSRRLYWEYTASLPRTLRLHARAGQARLSWISVWLSRTMYLVFWIPSRTYDPNTRRHSFRRLFEKTEERMIP